MMKSRLRCIFFSALCLGVIGAAIPPATGQTYPARPIRLIVPYPPGGAADATARILWPRIGDVLGQQIVIDNRGGASGIIGADIVAKSAADGYTLLHDASAFTVNPALRKLPFDPLKDLMPVAMLMRTPNMLVVHPSVPVRNVKELIALARAQPGKLSYGSVGVGTTPHLSAEALKMMAGINILHVPFKGGLDNVIANASGLVDMVCASIPSLMPFIGQGTPRLRALAVTSAKRTALMPAVPSLSESGVPGYDRSSWVGILAPAAVPKDIVAKVNASLVKVINTAEMRESFTRQGVEPQTNTPEQFAAYISSHLEQNTRLIKAIGLRPE